MEKCGPANLNLQTHLWMWFEPRSKLIFHLLLGFSRARRNSQFVRQQHPKAKHQPGRLHTEPRDQPGTTNEKSPVDDFLIDPPVGIRDWNECVNHGQTELTVFPVL